MATSTTPFTPYWKPVGHTEDPFSYIFFVVAEIDGCPGRPLAVVSSLGNVLQDETLQGSSLLVACHRILTIFSDPSNHAAVRLELGLSASFYEDGTQSAHIGEPVTLPEFDRQNPDRAVPSWHKDAVYPFPFISSCLLQGVGLDVKSGTARATHLEPLNTVYNDSSAEWGMVVIDITNLEAVRYGIVGFPAGPMKYVSSPRDEQVSHVAAFAGERGSYRVAVEERPRIPTSAAEYAANFKEERRAAPDQATLALLYGWPVIDTAAMSLVWPGASVKLEGNAEQSAAINRAIENALKTDDFNESVFDTVRGVSDFRAQLQCIVAKRLQTNPPESTALDLIRYTFSDQGHLHLEMLRDVSTALLSDLLTTGQVQSLVSLSLCIDTVQATPAQIAEMLSQQNSLRQLFLLQSPSRESDKLSATVFIELSHYPDFLEKTEVMVSGAYSSALRARPWLPRSSTAASTNVASARTIYPVEQVFVRSRYVHSHPFEYECIRVSDGLLKSERFVSGLLYYLRTRVMPDSNIAGLDNTANQLFAFSTAPASLAASPAQSAMVSPILPESFATLRHATSAKEHIEYKAPNPVTQSLMPGQWAVLVTIDSYPGRFEGASYIRYAFIRPIRDAISSDSDEHAALSVADIEVASMKEFLAFTAPDVDVRLLDCRIQDVVVAMTTDRQSVLPSHVEPMSVMSREDAYTALLDSLRHNL